MKTAKRLLPLLLVFLIAFIIGCSVSKKSDVEKVIANELNLLKNLDSETTLKYISYKELFPDATKDTELSAEVKEVFSLFFKNFNYKILDVSVDQNQKSASASIRLSTLDSMALAQDFTRAQLKDEILRAAQSGSADTAEPVISLEERYLLLNHLLKTNEYETVESNCEIGLQQKNDQWVITRTYSLENSLVGGLMTYLSDPDILPPEDTLVVYLKTLEKMNTKEMSNYLGVESILSTSDPNKAAIASALVEQVHKTFDYKVTDCTIDSYTATILAEITTFDSDAILANYQSEANEYLSSADAVIDGAQKRYEKSLDLLLGCIKDNQDTTTSRAEFHLVNDGASWKFQDDGNILGNAIFGTLSTTPVEQAQPEM